MPTFAGNTEMLRGRAVRLVIGAGATALVSLALAAAPPGYAAASRTEGNKQAVLAFYETGLNQKDYATASRYFDRRYVQHNPAAAEGKEGFARFIEYLRANYPDSHSSIRQVFADGDFVILHVLEKLHPDDRGNAIVETLSRPARTSFTLRPVGSLDRPRQPLSRGFDEASCPALPLVSFRINRQLSGWNLPP